MLRWTHGGPLKAKGVVQRVARRFKDNHAFTVQIVFNKWVAGRSRGTLSVCFKRLEGFSITI